MSSSKKSASEGNEMTPRRFIGVYFKCCRVYNRIYLNEGPKQTTWCPKCGVAMEITYSPTGSDKPFFTAE
ncbi:MAG: hypothetical protein IIB00_03060 [candidate division Zixibacteria bacterium]|nr:hypothetical protein [candidate division Zixibacteria bacterium]